MLVSLLAAGCGGGDEPAGAHRFERLEFAPTRDAAPVRAAELVARFELPSDGPSWTVEAPIAEVPDPAQADAEARLVLAAGKGGRRVRAVRTGALDASGFNRIRVTAAFAGHGALQGQLMQAGRTVQLTEELALMESATPTSFDLRLPHWRAPLDASRFDQLGLEVTGNARRLEITAIELFLDPLEEFLPDPEAPPELARLFATTRTNWQIIADTRRAVGLTDRRPLEATFEAYPGAEVVLSFAEPEYARGPGPSAGGKLLATLTDESGRTRSEAMAWPAAAGVPEWTRWRLPLGELDSDRVTLRLQLAPVAAAEERACLVAESALVPGNAQGAGQHSAPSVLLVTSDTHRADHMSASPDAVGVATPALDALAARGVYFERAFTWANVTNPSHIALMTGTHPRDTGILDNEHPLARAAGTLAERFAERGYATWAAISVRHLEDRYSGLGQGFDRMLSPFGRDQRADVVISRVEAWLAERGEAGPVFVWLHVFDAHAPYAPPEEFAAAYPAAKEVVEPLPVDREGAQRTSAEVGRQRALYKGEVGYLDGQLGRLFALPAFRDGVIAATSDHGESLGSHGIYFDHVGLYPDTLHVPLILTWPGGPRGARVTGLAAQADVGRTLLDLAGCEQAEFPGEDLRRHLQTQGAGWDENTAPHFALHANAVGASMTLRGYHLVLGLPRVLRGQRIGEHTVELYDLRTDPECRVDLAESDFERARTLRAGLVRWLEGARDLGWAGAGQVDSRMAAELEALGYAEGGAEAGTSLWVPDDCAVCLRFR